MLKKLYDWMGRTVYYPHANLILGVLFYLEAIFFLPTDPVLIVYCLERRNKALTYATIATIASVLGGITSYFLGYILWQFFGEQILQIRLVAHVLPEATFNHLCSLYKEYESWAVLAAAFTPIPYKAATFAAGICHLSLAPFIIFSAIGRGARFYLLAITIKIWGHHIKQYIDRYFNLIALLALLLIIITAWLVR
jgi:membrane protein YqaA with SNARE-associated domain